MLRELIGKWVLNMSLLGFASYGVARAELPLNWCASEKASVPGCSAGDCDGPSERNKWFPVAQSALTTIRIKFIIFRDDDTFHEATSDFAVSQQVAALNAAFQPYLIEFVQQSNQFVDCTRFNRLCSGVQGDCHHVTNLSTCVRDDLFCRGDVANTEEQLMKYYYHESPDTQLNVYVVHADDAGFKGLAYGPWCSDAQDYPGGLVIDGGEIGGSSGCGGVGCEVLVHEVGHILGLWHTFRGSSEVDCEDNCYEGPECDGDCPTDVETCDYRGDFCCDTAGTPAFLEGDGCYQPSTSDIWCTNGNFAAIDYDNYMWYGGNGCWDHFTRQQSARMQCWSCDALSSWVESEDCNSNSQKDICDIREGESDDCDGNGVPDECQADCNNNDVADVCDIANQTSLDCDENGVPDECQSQHMPVRACCYGGDSCMVTTECHCEEISGIWTAWSSCGLSGCAMSPAP